MGSQHKKGVSLQIPLEDWKIARLHAAENHTDLSKVLMKELEPLFKRLRKKYKDRDA